MKNQNEGQEKKVEKENKRAERKAARDEKRAQEGKRPFKEIVKSKNFKHGTLSTLLSIGFVVVIVLVNVIFSALTDRFPSMNIDLTKNCTNTLAEEAVKVVDYVKEKTVINILASENNANSGEYAQVVALANKMAERNSNITVEFTDLDQNPTFKSKYDDENISSYNVVVESEKRYRVVTADDMFPTELDQSTYQQVYYQDVDSQLASAVSAVNAESLPVAAFDTAHNESGAAGYRSLLESNNFEVVEFNLLTEEIPENAQYIVLSVPQTDLSEAEVEKLDNFLNDQEDLKDRTVMFVYYPGMTEVSNLEAFINEWGLSVETGRMVVENDSASYYSRPDYLLMSANTDLDLEGTSSDYGYLLVPQANPVDILFESRSGVTTYPLLSSSDSSVLYGAATGEVIDETKRSYCVGALAQRVFNDNEEQKSYYSNVVVLGSGSMIVQNFLEASTFGNAKYLVDIARYGTGTTGVEAAVPSNKQQSITTDITMSSSMMNWMGLGVFTIVFPILVLATGLVVFLRRRHL